MSLKHNTTILGVSLAMSLIRLFKLGSGSTWPGHIALKSNPSFIKDIVSNAKNLKIILVVGTNGKTTTSKLLRFIFEKKGLRVFQNEEGANLLNGIASTLLRHVNLLDKGNTKDEVVAIFEVDENALPLLLKQLTPDVIVILNLFRDQLDRYGEVNIIADKWREALQTLPETTQLILNGDDPQIAYLGKKTKAKTSYYGLAHIYIKAQEMPHDVDSTYCPNCGERLKYKGFSYSHLGDYMCPKCDFQRPLISTFSNEIISSSLQGIYNLYNISAVVLALHTVFDFELSELGGFIKEFQPAFGRQEKLEYQGRQVYIQLSKNPVSFNQSIAVAQELVKNNQGNVLIVLNDRVPDGKDISWIWDVEFENLKQSGDQIFVAGDRVWDMAVRMKYAGFENIDAHQYLENAIKSVVEKTEQGKIVFILCTYSAMLEVRQILRGRKLL